MQATGTEQQVSSKQLAGELLTVWHHVMRGSSEHMYALIAELDLSLTQMKTLHALSDCVREISVKELADRLGLSLPGGSRIVDGLLRRGWVERREDPDDRRVKRVGITDAGRTVVERIETARLVGLEQYAESLTPDQRSRLYRALSDLPHHT